MDLNPHLGRRNWDYVSMDDYDQDMKDLSNQASGLIQRQRQEIRHWKTLVYLLLKKTGPFEIGLFPMMHALDHGEICEISVPPNLGMTYFARDKRED